MNELSIDPQEWNSLRNHLKEATQLLALLRRKHEPVLNYKQYSKLQGMESTIEKFAGDIAEAFQGLIKPGEAQ